MRSTLVAALAIAAGLALAATSGAVGTRAHAQVTTAPVSVFFGYVSPDDHGTLPQRVRATVSGITCGTADITRFESGLGFYILTVHSAETKTGCGEEGASVAFLFLSGEVDTGSPAAQAQAWRVGAQRMDLSAVPDATFGTFVGDLPPGPGIAFLRWSGSSATETWRAVATIQRDVESVSYLEASTQRYLVYVPGAPATLSTYLLVDRDDIVIVRLR